MDITPEMRAIINGLPGANPTPAAPEGGGFGRVLKNVANLPSNIIEGLGQGVVSIAQLGNPGAPDQVSVPKPFDVGAPQTTGDVVGDFFVGKHGLVDTASQILLPAGAIGRAGSAIGMGGKAFDAGRFFVGESLAQAGTPESSATDIGVAGTVGGLQEPLSHLPMRARLPLSALLAAGHGLYEGYQRGGFAGGVTAGADFLAGLIGMPGKAAPGSPARPLETSIAHNLSEAEQAAWDAQANNRGGLDALIGRPNGPRPTGLMELPGAGDITPSGGLIDLPRPRAEAPAPVPKPVAEVSATAMRMQQANAAHGYAPTMPKGAIQGIPPSAPAGSLMAVPSAPQMIDPRQPGGIMRMPQTLPPRIATLQNVPPPTSGTATPRLRPLAEETQLPPRINPEPPAPVEAAQVARAVELKPEQKIKWTEQEQAFAKDLSARYSKLSERDLKEDIFDLDNHIANAPDEASVRSYRLARDTAQNVLDTRRAPVEAAAEAVAEAPKAKLKLRRNGEVGYKSEMGDVERATVVEFSNKNQTARIRFADSPREFEVPYSRLETENLPEKVATLQKRLDPDEVASREIRDNLEAADESMQRVDVSEIERSQERAGAPREKFGSEDLHGDKYSPGTGTGVQEPKAKVDLDAHIEPALKAKLQEIIDEVIFKTNRNQEIGFSTNIKGSQAAVNTAFGRVEVNQKVIADWFRDWPNMSSSQRGQVMVKFAQLLGHEVGHSALLWLRSQDMDGYKNLIKEFKNLAPESRHKLLEKFYTMTGRSPYSKSIPYSAGNPEGILGGYPFLHPRAQEALDDFGMEEFFAEMFSAHTLGLLNEKLLPKEMRSFWDRIKDVFRRLVSLFEPSKYDDIGDLEELASLQVFNEMVEEIAEGFRKSSGDAHFRAMGKGSSIRDASAMKFIRQSENLKKVDEADLIARDKALKAKSKKEGFIENPDFISDDIQIEYGYKGAWWTPTSGLKHAFSRELTQELGSTLAGAILGGVAGPELTDGNISMAESILMGGVLGAFGPRAIKALLAVPKHTGSTFHHRTFAESLAQIFKGNAEGVAADAATGHGSSVAKFVRFLERNMNLHLPPELFNAVTEADGAAAWALHTVDDSFKKVKSFDVSPAMEAATEAYLKGGPLADYRKTVAGLSIVDQRAGDFYVAAREAIATLQSHFAAGLPDGTLKKKILDSMAKGDYLTRQYRIFHDKKYRPTQMQIEAVAMKYVSDNPTITLDAARSIVENYIHEIKIAGTDYRGSVTDVGKKLDSYLWEKRDKLDSAFRDMLGEYHDPREKVLGTISHLYTSSITGRLIDTITQLKDKLGLNFSYGLDEHSLEIEKLQSAISHGRIPPGKTVATLQKELDTLRAYVPLDGSSKYGKLANTMVSRFVRDQLATFDSPWGLLDGSIMRSMAKFHNAVKIARAPLNPITVVRNIIAMPVLTAIGGANPLTDIRRAYKLIKAGGPEVREMLENGILNVDAIRGEMLRNVDYVRMLDIDNSITGLVKKGVNKALDFYRWPDMLVRGATYVSAKAKFAKELGLPETHADVIAKARDWTNRYTVNYANVAPIVKTLRQVPFTNLFISYTAEITRIVKNLVQDAFKHDDPGQRVRAAGLLGGLTALPFVAEKFATMQLSEKDRKDWEKARSLMPDYQRTKHLIVTGRNPDGRFHYFDMTPLMQVDAMTQMGRALATGDMKAAAAVNPIVSWENTPALNIVAEQLTGEDLRSGRPIDKNILTRAKAVLDDVVPPILPGGYEFRRWSEALSPTQSGELGTTNARTGRRTTPGEIVSSYLTGMRFGTVDASKLTQFAVSDAKRKIADEQAYLRDVVRTDAPAKTKEKAIARYQETARQILLELTQKLQPPS